MKKKLLLSTALKLQADLERMIKETEESIIKYNETEISTNKLFDTLEKQEAQLINIKEAIQNANKTKGSDGKTNNYWIYYRANLKKRLDGFLNMFNVSDEKKAQLSTSDVNKMRKQLAGEVAKLTNKLTAFNSNKHIKVEVDEDLNLILE